MSTCRRCRARSIWRARAAPRSRSTRRCTRDAYRVLGYRQCGERAVRVDILERLADLIRPALAWRETSPGEKPTGAFDGRGFVVTQAMTSLTGSAGEDFASILRALGYRMDKRPPLPPKPAPVDVVETVSAETPPVEASCRDDVRDAGGRSRRRSAGRRRRADVRRSRRRRPRCCPTSRRCRSRAKRLRLRSRLRPSKPQPEPRRRKPRSRKRLRNMPKLQPLKRRGSRAAAATASAAVKPRAEPLPQRSCTG